MPAPAPAGPPTDLTHVRIPLDPADEGSPHSESVWAEPMGGDCYRIANVPFFAHDVGLHDVVLAIPVGPHLELVEVVERRCVASFNYELDPGVDTAVFFAGVRGTGAATECLASRCYTTDLFHAGSADAFERQLQPHCRWFERFDAGGALVREYGDLAA
jgi:hypothetical protein